MSKKENKETTGNHEAASRGGDTAERRPHAPDAAPATTGEQRESESSLAREAGARFQRLVELMELLRSPQGCPWDREQTMESLRPFLLEETYEVLEAMGDSPEHHCEELGDLLLQIVFQAQLATEDGNFGAKEVVQSITDKLIRRHPHVFGGDSVIEEADQVMAQWQEIKRRERGERGLRGEEDEAASQSHTPGMPVYIKRTSWALPSLVRAVRASGEAAVTGFDWPDHRPVIDKVREEIGELEEAIAGGDPAHLEHELGDLLLASANLARHLNIDPEIACQKATDRFVNRFHQVASRLHDQGSSPARSSLEEMEELWQKVKQDE